MILKARKPAAGSKAESGSRRRPRPRPPVDVELSVAFRFGDAPEDRVTVIDARRVPMIGSLLDNRDRIVRGFVSLLLRAAVSQPRVARQLFPRARAGNATRQQRS